MKRIKETQDEKKNTVTLVMTPAGVERIRMMINLVLEHMDTIDYTKQKYCRVGYFSLTITPEELDHIVSDVMGDNEYGKRLQFDTIEVRKVDNREDIKKVINSKPGYDSEEKYADIPEAYDILLFDRLHIVDGRADSYENTINQGIHNMHYLLDIAKEYGIPVIAYQQLLETLNPPYHIIEMADNIYVHDEF